jgi:hypothetical protein
MPLVAQSMPPSRRLLLYVCAASLASFAMSLEGMFLSSPLARSLMVHGCTCKASCACVGACVLACAPA